MGIEEENAVQDETAENTSIELLQRDLEHAKTALNIAKNNVVWLECKVKELIKENDCLNEQCKALDAAMRELDQLRMENERYRQAVNDMGEFADGLKAAHRETIRAFCEYLRD